MKRTIWAVFMAAALWAGGPAMAQDTNSDVATQDSMSGTVQTEVNTNGTASAVPDTVNSDVGLTTDPTVSNPMTPEGTTDTTTTDSMSTTDTTTTDTTTNSTTSTTDSSVNVSGTEGQREVIEEERTTTTTTVEPVISEPTTTTETDATTGVTEETTTTTTTETRSWDTGADTTMDTTGGEMRDAATYDESGAIEADTGAGANEFYRTGWDPSALMLLGGGLMAGSLALRGRGRKRS